MRITYTVTLSLCKGLSWSTRGLIANQLLLFCLLAHLEIHKATIIIPTSSWKKLNFLSKNKIRLKVRADDPRAVACFRRSGTTSFRPRLRIVLSFRGQEIHPLQNVFTTSARCTLKQHIFSTDNWILTSKKRDHERSAATRPLLVHNL